MERHFVEADLYHRPVRCEECGGIMIFKGVGEYHCEDCRHVQYDDYGKARLYIEKHHGANAAQVEAATGVSQKTIRQMLKDNKLEISQDSTAFLKCEICGASIRSGKLCSKCEMNYHRRLEEEQRQTKNMQGFGNAKKGDSGAKRFYYE
ncbi:MAG: hypothetical protein SOY45_05720 [Lachnospiraceae bacterium]|nr:hypothetical protein [Lachnospiraceae bacterium]MDY4069361.1 hypothetical protein [Lachnospiraceae bacterium]